MRIYDPQWDRDTKLRTNHDTAAIATMYLALTGWMFGEADRARKLASEALVHALDCNHVPTTATAGLFKALFEAINNRADTAARDAQTLIGLLREHATPTFLAFAIIIHGWARARLGERGSGMVELNEGLTDYIRQGNRIFLPLFWGLLAEIEAEGHGAEGALTRVDEALALVTETGEHWTDFFSTASAARFCSSATLQTRRRRRKPSLPRSPWRKSKKRGASSCAPPCHWLSFINQPSAPPTRMPCSRQRSKAFRRRRNFPRLRKRRRYSPRR